MNLIERHHRRRVGIWLLVCCLVLFSLIMLGGATRLTGSGLSMVVWEPVTGVVPPMNEADWQLEFDAYRATPEYQKVNRGMALHEFKVKIGRASCRERGQISEESVSDKEREREMKEWIEEKR